MLEPMQRGTQYPLARAYLRTSTAMVLVLWVLAILLP